MARTRKSASGRFSERRNNVNLIEGSLKLGPVANTVLVIVMVSFVGLMYLSQVTRQNDFSFEVNQLTERRDELTRQNQSLRVQQARLQAVERIENSTAAAELVEPVNIRYIE